MANRKWRTIDSAPVQRLLLLWALADTETGNWKMATGFWMPGYRDEPGCWEWEGRRLKPYDLQPTHWMPLPNPPMSRTAKPTHEIGWSAKRGTNPNTAQQDRRKT
jgi:hypothetical protein